MHRSAVQLYQFTDDAKPETQSGVALRCRITVFAPTDAAFALALMLAALAAALAFQLL